MSSILCAICLDDTDTLGLALEEEMDWRANPVEVEEHHCSGCGHWRRWWFFPNLNPNTEGIPHG